jgi:hypothetical protein
VLKSSISKLFVFHRERKIDAHLVLSLLVALPHHVCNHTV